MKPMHSDGTQTLTFLMTDIQGSTKLWEAHPTEMPAVIALHEELISATVDEFGGRVVKSRGEGDSTFSVFEVSAHALECADAISARIRDTKWPGELMLRVRTAVHAGPANARDDDYYGSTINRCARLREVANAGQVLVSQAAVDLANTVGQFELVDLGVHRLRDLLRPERIFQLGGAHDSFPAIRTLSSVRNNLPPQLTTFVGRRTAFADLAKILGANRLVTILGTGGCGKTRLALQLGAERQHLSPDGVWFVDLRPLSDLEGILVAIASSIGAGGETIDAISDALNRAPAQTLILDNAEHVLQGVRDVVSALVARTKEIRFVVTSRESLRLAGEVLYRIPTLELPPDGMTDLRTLSEIESVSLFLDRARICRPGFELSDRNAAAIASICVRLDGLPLAIEPVAGLVDMMSPQQIAALLDDRFGLLATAADSSPDPSRTIETAIDWSYSMLSDAQRTLLHRLAVFPATFASDAVDAVCCGGLITHRQVLGLLRELADKSMIAAVHTESETRFRLLELVREYVLNRPSEDVFEFEPPLLNFAQTIASEADSAISGAGPGVWLEKLDWEAPTVRWALEHGEREYVARLAFLMRRYWHRRGLLSEGLYWLRFAAEVSVDLDVAFQAEITNALGVFALERGNLEEAYEKLLQAVNRFESLGQIDRQLGTMINLGIILHDLGRIDEAIAMYRRAVESLRSR